LGRQIDLAEVEDYDRAPPAGPRGFQVHSPPEEIGWKSSRGHRNPAMNEQSLETTERRGEPTPTPQKPASAEAASPEKQKPTGRRKMLLGALGVLILAGALWFGIPWVQLTLSTVSTDDAYVNGHVTFVAARVRGQVARVLVDDNYRVHKGDLLVELDKEPFQIAVAIKKAAVDTATADLQVAKANVRGIEAEAMSRRRALEHAIEDVDDQVALLHARVADVDKSKAELTLAQLDFDRAAKLVVTNDIPREVYDRRQAALLAARADVVAALADVRQIRASLGLPPESDEADLGQVPPNLDQTFSSVLQAQAAMIQSAAQLGVIHSFDEGPRHMVEAFEKEGDVNTTFARLAADAPDVKQAEAKLEVAKRDLAQAELDLRYCDVIAEIDGVITRRNVNPGDNIQVGQSLMAIRSLNEIWVDANFKETQLANLRIGQPVDLYVDMYGGRQVFEGRISGFTMGTGSTLALLPAENATGNFVKVVQRLPVRIDLENYDPDKNPLFIGTSVEPYVYFKRPPTGPNAGKFLQAFVPESQTGGATANPPGANK
jgi:membrane fusion protein, multidrug efflux system